MNSGFWQEDDEPSKALEAQVVDLAFAIDQGRQLPVDHVEFLAKSVSQRLPWLLSEPSAGIHQIQAAASGNGWLSPQDSNQPWIVLSARTKLVIRIPAEKIELAMRLSGESLDIGGLTLKIGNCRKRPLAPSTALFARYLRCDEEQSEPEFLKTAAQQLGNLGIDCKKMISGLPHHFKINHKPWHSRSLMLADLSLSDSIRLQEQGLGEAKIYGFGLFIPHKDIKRVEAR